jgi:hypothetical protein
MSRTQVFQNVSKLFMVSFEYSTCNTTAHVLLLINLHTLPKNLKVETLITLILLETASFLP